MISSNMAQHNENVMENNDVTLKKEGICESEQGRIHGQKMRPLLAAAAQGAARLFQGYHNFLITLNNK